MGQITWGSFTPKRNNRGRKLMLDKDEQARICFLENAPYSLFIHNFEKVTTDPQGNPVIKQDQWPDGSPREVVVTEFAGKFRCLGDEDEVQRTGADPENCPACRAHIQNPNAVKAPTKRILGRVLKYGTKEGSFAPSKPFSATLLVWDLTEKRFDSVNEIFLEHGPLSKKDLLLGPCENKQMQKYTIAVGSGDAAYLASKDTQQYVHELLQEEKIEDLPSIAGKLPSAYEMEAKVSEVVRAYNHAFGISASAEGAESLLGEDNVTKVADKPKAKKAVKEEEDDEQSAASSTAPDEEEVEDSLPPANSSNDDDDDDDDTEPDEDGDQMTASLDDLLASFQ